MVDLCMIHLQKHLNIHQRLIKEIVANYPNEKQSLIKLLYQGILQENFYTLFLSVL